MTQFSSAYDALFVINQECDLRALGAFCREQGFGAVFLLTTHALFDHEVEMVRAALPVAPQVATFADFLTDEDMSRHDDEATAELVPRYRDSGTKRDGYNGRFMALSLRKKNVQVRDDLLARTSFGAVWHADGLGIVADVWQAAGSRALTPPVFEAPGGHPFVSRVLGALYRLKDFWATRQFYVVRSDDDTFLFLSAVRRLRLTAAPVTVSFNPVLELLRRPWSLSRGAWVRRVARKHAGEARQVTVSTTIHEYRGWMTRLGVPLTIFVDGYHPENYPRSYIDMYASRTFVTRTMFDRRWFEKYGCRSLPSPGCLEKEWFREVPTPGTVRTVLLMLNHAGDWTSLINRSDTDLLIADFVRAAARFPELRFIIRPHPTMVQFAHEGPHSIQRIKTYVASIGLPNLEVSVASLDDDFARGDLYVSEYSQTLLDVYRIGKLGLIANCTRRRSFMADYENIGFAAKRADESVGDAIAGILDDPSAYTDAQNAAVREYNDLLQRYYREVRPAQC